MSRIFNKNIVIKLDKPELNSRVSIKLSYLNDKNIFFIDKKNILKNLEKVNYLENIKIKKVIRQQLLSVQIKPI